ncbi:N-acetylneuraminate synthase family protein [Curtobacterium oceanosedimentum]|uniref:N-acetylneuraminate synthase family protein n=1 Tax=Curtobacterium oceanosedimentum TaxID=465820 RepID=UPI000A76EC88|nr:N-acetylneuraminate synthase family protein [Curtobacterium oceanosedimentum]
MRRTLTNAQKVEIVAELTTNHFGDLRRLERMIRRASDAGADFIKVQRRSVEDFYTDTQLAAPYESPFGTTFRDYRSALELHEDGFALLDRVCDEEGIPWFASALDSQSVQYFAQRGHSLVKLPSTVSHHSDLIEAAARSGLDVVLSTGMVSEEYVDLLLRKFEAAGRIYLLQCISAYPAPVDACNIAVVRSYSERSRVDPRIIPGYSSHDDGSFVSTLAVAAGARMLEKHVKLGSTSWAHFDEVALDLETGAFHDYVRDVRYAELATGSGRKEVEAAEHHKYPWRVREVAQ